MEQGRTILAVLSVPVEMSHIFWLHSTAFTILNEQIFPSSPTSIYLVSYSLEIPTSVYPL